MKIKALIFDFDGLLINTEELRVMAFDELLKEYGKSFDSKDYSQTMLGGAEKTTLFLMDKYGLEGNAEELTAKRWEIFKKLFEERLALMDGVEELLERIKNWDMKLAVATGRNREQVVDALTRLGILERFVVIVTPDDLVKSQGKPDPEIYQIAAKKLKVGPGECLVLEDAPFGVDAAKAAGMRVIYVPDARYVDTNHKDADAIFKSLHGLTDDVMQKLTEK